MGTGSLNRELIDLMLPRKTSKPGLWIPVPQTDTGRQEEYSKALEITLVKELGKLAP